MKGKIDKYGDLSIYRGQSRGFIGCKCPLSFETAEYIHSTCGDWCPLFGEPVQYKIDKPSPIKWVLDLCHDKTLYFEELIDEREGVEG